MAIGIEAGRRVAAGSALCLLAACTTAPPGGGQVTPSQAVERMTQVRGEQVEWAGRIVSVTNEARSTRLVVLSHPRSRDGFPNTNRRTTGRFVVRYDGFLEPQDYAPGRLLTATGRIDDLITTSVDQAEFLVPRLNAERLRLWDVIHGRDRGPRFGFGLGISIGL